MHAKGTFDISLTPRKDPGYPAGRMLIEKTYRGDMTGEGTGQMISKRTENGASVYYAVEEFSGSAQGLSGGFTLVHKGYMSKDSQVLEVTILEGSGSGEFKNATGSMTIEQDGNTHRYELTFEV